MPTLSKPINIPGPWAYNGDKNTIPDTGADVGLASWAQGWGLVNQLPLTAGGIPPARADFNGALNALSAHVYYQQSGAYYDWSADLMYPFPARVLGSDGKVYDWVSASGSGTSAGAQDPTTDSNRTWWTPAVTGGDLPEFDGTTIKLINGKYGVPEFTAPTADGPGKAGLVPGPAVGQGGNYLRGDGTWGQPGLAVGAIIWSAAASAPEGYLICTGAPVSRTTYAALFAAIGTSYGAGDGSTTFNLPNLMGRVAWGGATPGQSLEAGLPDIAGGVRGQGNRTGFRGLTGAFYGTGSPIWSSGAADTSYDKNKFPSFGFAASRSNGIYGASATVQPPALTLVPYIKY